MASAQRTSMLTEAREREMRASSSVSHKQQSVIWWVRRDLRLFDNPALLAAIATGSAVVRKNKTNMEARILSVFLSIYVSVRVCVCVCVCVEASLSLVRGTRSAYFLQVVEIVHNGTCVCARRSSERRRARRRSHVHSRARCRLEREKY